MHYTLSVPQNAYYFVMNTVFYSAEKILTASPIQPKEESSENDNKDSSEHETLEHDQPVKSEGKTKIL